MIFVQEKHTQERGAAALLIIVIVAAAALLITQTTAQIGLGELDLGYTSQKGGEALGVADGCMEETLRRIRLDTVYGVGAGTVALSVSNGSCTIDVVDLGGNQRRITITGTVDDYNRKIEGEILLSGATIDLTSWRELDS